MGTQIRLFAGLCAFVASAVAATAPAPNYYTRQDYGNNKGCTGGATFAVGDINGDGIPDIVCSGGQFLYGRGNGTFTLSPEYLPLMSPAVALLDLNGDGKPDIISLNNTDGYGFKVAFNDGNGTFGTPTFYSIPDSDARFLQTGDFNGDGIPDAVTVANQGVWLMTGGGGGIFGQPVLAVAMPTVNAVSRFQAADINEDGKLDLVVSTQSGFSVLFGNGNGTFQPAVNYATTFTIPFLTVADINGDGYLDILCASPQSDSSVTIYLGKAGGSFQNPYFFDIPNYLDVEVGDVNGDGIPDLVSDSVYVAYGLGKGEFSTPVYFPIAGGSVGSSTSVLLAHLRSEKVLDIIANNAFDNISVLLNKGNGSFIEGITVPFPSNIECGTELDFNNDGIEDLGFVQGQDFIIEYGTGKVKEPFTAGPVSVLPAETGYTFNCPSNPGDLNGDGIPDMLSSGSNGSAGVLVPFYGQGDGSFVAGTPTASAAGTNSWLILVDVNGDGKTDLITPQTNQVWYGNGNGTFQSPITFVSGLANSIFDVQWADLNGDGKLDFAVEANVSENGILQCGTTYILLATGGGAFTQSSVSNCPNSRKLFFTSAIALGDLNGDGYPDLVVGSDESEMGVFLNNGTGTFTYSVTLNVAGLLNGAPTPVIADFNGDGILDVGVSDGTDFAILPNEGDAVFKQADYFGQTDYQFYIGNWHGQSAAAGLPDIFIPNGSSTAQFLENITK
jgi:hypothetical protein